MSRIIFKKSPDVRHFLNRQLGVEKDSTAFFIIQKQRDKVSLQPNNNHIFHNDFLNLVKEMFGDTSISRQGRINLSFSEWTRLAKRLNEQETPLFEDVEEVDKVITEKPTFEQEPPKRKSEALVKFEKARQLMDEKGFNPTSYSDEEKQWLYENYEGAGGLAKEGVKGTTGILHEFYTPDFIVSKMFGLAVKNGFKKDGVMLEPSCGTGRFLAYHDPKLIDAYEIDKYAHLIAQMRYPEANIKLASIETNFFQGQFHAPHKAEAKYDLVIGNPPYDVNYSTPYSERGEKARTGAKTIDQYFIRAGLDLLKSGGLLVMIVPSSFMRNDLSYNDFKRSLGKFALFLDAYRLPNGSFGNTQVGTDIIVLSKK